MEEEISKKQQYLKTQIMDQGYDTGSFVQFLQSKKENGDDINNWDLHELKLACKIFKQQADEEQNPPPPVPEIDDAKLQQHTDQQQIDKGQVQPEQNVHEQQVQQEQQEQIQQQQQQEEYKNQQQEEEQQQQENPEDQQQNQNQEDLQQQQQVQDQNIQQSKAPKQNKQGDDNHFSKSVKCRQVIPNELTQCSDVCIVLNNYEKKSGGMFSASYIAYKIQTYPFKWEVSRRYSDFVSMRNILMKIYPAQIIPPISRRTNTRSYQPMFINKRMNMLEKFLNKLIKNPELRASKYVQGFLSLEEKDFKNLLKEGDKLQQTYKLDQFQSTSGYVDVELNEEINNYCSKALDYYNHADPIYKKIRQQSKQLIMDFDQLSSTLYNLGESFSQLYNQSQSFNVGLINQKYQNPYLDDTYVTLNNMCVQWGNVMTTQLKVIQENITNFFKYYNSEGRLAKESLKMRDDINKKYLDHKQKLLQKKEKLFLQGNIQHWDIAGSIQSKYGVDKIKADKELAFRYMLPKETIHERELQEKSAYFSKYLFDDVQRLINEKVQEYSDHFNKFGHLQTDNIQEMHVLWADAMTSLETQGQHGKKLQMIQKVDNKLGDDHDHDHHNYE